MVAAGALSAGVAHAHVRLEKDQAAAGEVYIARFDVAHGCHGAPTKSLTIDLPPGVSDVKPQAKPGWSVTIKPIALGGEAVTFRGELAPHEKATFAIVMHLPDKPGLLAFPVAQVCPHETIEWSQIASPVTPLETLKHPAPVLMVAPSP
jgi:uncharacterized protein YcnI